MRVPPRRFYLLCPATGKFAYQVWICHVDVTIPNEKKARLAPASVLAHCSTQCRICFGHPNRPQWAAGVPRKNCTVLK